MSGNYILDVNNNPVPEKDTLVWGKWFESHSEKKIVAKDTVGYVRVSTVFLGLDHSFGEGPPILFETMVFGGAMDQEQIRYSTWDEALEGHKHMIERVKEKTEDA